MPERAAALYSVSHSECVLTRNKSSVDFLINDSYIYRIVFPLLFRLIEMCNWDVKFEMLWGWRGFRMYQYVLKDLLQRFCLDKRDKGFQREKWSWWQSNLQCVSRRPVVIFDEGTDLFLISCSIALETPSTLKKTSQKCHYTQSSWKLQKQNKHAWFITWEERAHCRTKLDMTKPHCSWCLSLAYWCRVFGSV